MKETGPEERTLDMGFAQIDLDRLRRQGVPEVVYGAGKTAGQIVAIVSAMRERGQSPVLITRIDPDKAAAVTSALGDAFEYFPTARIGRIGPARKPDGRGRIAVVCAGTSDLPVAEEAAITAETLGNEVSRMADVGVAGMEGALASVVGGLVRAPVIAVPTSVGYGAAFGGLSALLSMLNSCAAGVSVVNIDNGFGAGFLASRINHMD